jgi:hypothetical protein
MEQEQHMLVWNSMPLMELHTFACEWLHQTFHGDISVDAILLVRYAVDNDGSDIVLPKTGLVVDIPLHDEDLLEINLRTSVIRRGNSVSVPTPGRIAPQGDPQLNSPRSYGHYPSLPTDTDGEGRGASDKSYDKLRQTFKLPKFTGNAKDWKLWNQALLRYLSIWELDYVTDPDFLDTLPLNSTQRRDNKLVFFILEDAVQGSPLARSYVHKAPMFNGFEAYYTLLDGFVFAGATTASLLLNELTNFRFKKDETPTELCLRLEELFQDLKSLPGDAAMVFNDTQCIGYLLGALRHEKEWETVHSYITSCQIKGNITFAEACGELRVRCEATRANQVIDRPVGGKKVNALVSTVQAPSVPISAEQIVALISTMSMKHQPDVALPSSASKPKGGRGSRPLYPCLAKDCTEQTPFPLCGTHYHSLIAAKIQSLELRQNYGNASYDAETKLVVYPTTVPSDRMPSNIKRVRNVAAAK